MCGIIGVLACGEMPDKKTEKVRQESMIFLASELLQLTQPRGKEATGISTLFDTSDYIGLKMGINAQEFVTRFGEEETTFEGYLNIWRRKIAKIVVGHCRKPSLGGAASADDNNNNHPIRVGDIVGVHNGTLTNHDKIFEMLGCKRDGKVDSEAIFRLLFHYTNEAAEPFTKEIVLETCKRLSGEYAVLAYNGNNPYQLAAFRDGRPLEMGIIRPLQLIILASDKDYIKMAFIKYNKMAHLYQTTGTKFIPITKKDVEIHTLSDDHMFLFDLKQGINAETTVDSLYTKAAIPRTAKVWTKGYNNNTYQPPANSVGQKKPLTTQTGGTTTQTPTSTQGKKVLDGDNSCEVGFSWNNKGMRYDLLTEEARTAAIKAGPVLVNGTKKKVIDVTTGTRITVQKETSEGIGLSESERPADVVICDPAKIEETKVKNEQPKHELVPVKNTTTQSATVNMSAYPEVVKAAVEVTKARPNFSNAREVADALNVVDIQSLKLMEVHSLANRIQKYFFQMGWEAGYVAHIEDQKRIPTNEGTARLLLDRAKTRVESSREIIRNLKGIVTLMGKILDNKITGSEGTSSFAAELGINPSVLRRVIRTGDKKGSNSINQLMILLEGSSSGGKNGSKATDTSTIQTNGQK